jgi:hypothetical protein
LKAASGAAGTEIVAAEFFDEFLFAADDAEAAFYLGFGGVSFAALRGARERRRGRRACWWPWWFSFSWDATIIA